MHAVNQDTLAIESLLVSAVWTDSRHHWHEGLKPFIMGKKCFNEQNIYTYKYVLYGKKYIYFLLEVYTLEYQMLESDRSCLQPRQHQLSLV